MGLIKYGPLAQEVSGTVGGCTFARVHSGKVVRGWRAPVNKRRPLQLTRRMQFSAASSKWLTSLTPAERTDWDTYAATCQFTNPLGEAYYLSGFNMFCRNTLLSYIFNGAWLTVCPVFNGFPTARTITYDLDHTTGEFSVLTISPSLDPGYLFYQLSALQRPTRTQLSPAIQATGSYDNPGVGPALFYTYPNPPLPGSAGDVAAGSRLYLVDEYDRISTPYINIETST